MKMTLTSNELKHAIACYLRANAAVEVGDITFSLKKAGIETVVETTVVEPVVETVAPIVIQPHIPTNQMLFGHQTVPTEFTADASELTAEFVEKEQQPEVDEVSLSQEETTESDEMRMMREVDEEVSASELEAQIAAVESAEAEPETQMDLFEDAPALVFDNDVKPETVEEMPIQNSIAIADILGTS